MTEFEALRDLVEREPDNAAIRLALARLLAETGDFERASQHLRLLADGLLDPEQRREVAQLALSCGDADTARRALTPEPATEPEPESPLRREAPLAVSHAADAPSEPDLVDEAGAIRFADVGGLDDVKQAIDRMIVKPLAHRGLFARYGRKPGGGVLLYGPPGCGKTMMARATAGELGVPFYNVRIEDVLDPYLGVSERRMAAAFDAARELSPCVLFLDELDGLGYSRARRHSEVGRGVIETLLQQLDGAHADNEGLLVLAASNEPWAIDQALLRPGRFDRTIFVPPPDGAARRRILELRLHDVPVHDLALDRVAAATELYSGADLRALVDRAVEEVLDEALRTGTEVPVTGTDLRRAIGVQPPTTTAWLQRGRNHVDFGNVGGRWDDLGRFLRRRSVIRALRT